MKVNGFIIGICAFTMVVAAIAGGVHRSALNSKIDAIDKNWNALTTAYGHRLGSAVEIANLPVVGKEDPAFAKAVAESKAKIEAAAKGLDLKTYNKTQPEMIAAYEGEQYALTVAIRAHLMVVDKDPALAGDEKHKPLRQSVASDDSQIVSTHKALSEAIVDFNKEIKDDMIAETRGDTPRAEIAPLR